VLDEIYGKLFFIFNAHKESHLTGKPGEIIATANHAICRATVDGAIWIGHLQPKLASGAKGIKLPATFVLRDLMPRTVSSLKALLSKTIKHIDIDYTQPGRQLPCQEIWYELDAAAAYLYFAFHNGGMSTKQCRLLLTVYQHVATLPVKAIVLMGGEECWSNGIHLNHIEIATSPADESWLNINAIDDLIHQIITTLDKLTVSALAGSAGAGGAIMALAADKVFAREGILFNPHYKNMGELYGSEYWTYLLPKRVGQEMATSLTEQRLPISAKKAWQIGLCDTVLDKNHKIFAAQVKQLVNALVIDSEALRQCLTAKAKTRCYDESLKALATYRQFELTQMYENFYGNENYHNARQHFVYKTSNETTTPVNIANHRQQEGQTKKLSPGSMYHFVWQDFYQMSDAVIDNQHQQLFNLANQLVCSVNREELINNIQLIVQHVKEHFTAEEELMEQLAFKNYKGHVREHSEMLEKLADINQKITNDDWKQNDIQAFMDKWGKHIINSDMAFNVYQKALELEPVG